MNKLIDYIKLKELENIELTLEIQYTKYLGWSVSISKKGYDIHLICVRKNDKEEAFDLAYDALKLQLEGNILY